MLAGVRPAGTPTRRSADATKVAALIANATRTSPPVAMNSPAAGASAIWALTATLHIALFAVIMSASSTTSGSSEVAAGLNTVAAALRTNAAANTAVTDPVAKIRLTAAPARTRSALTIS